ncbi:Nif3-like dinuclear metal center hexameric protein [bacterium 210820-DFI.6.37]|nr:Nif3-like dinuclear metal center hexameric protein [bacterium 210820-DFI.6.37]
MRLEELIQVIDEIAPRSTQESWDNSGIQIAAGQDEIRKVLTSLEITDAVIDEADEADADMIITHHPLIFGGIKSVDYREMTGSYIVKLLNLGISVYSCHTPFDKAAGGNNDFLADLIGLTDVDGFCVDGEINRIGRVGRLRKPVTLAFMLDLAAERLRMDPEQIRAVGRPDLIVETVGICTGAGADLMDLAAENGCQLFITGDLKYHDAQKAKAMGMAVIDAGHYGTEKSFAANFAAKLAEKTEGKIEIEESNVDIDPFEMI